MNTGLILIGASVLAAVITLGILPYLIRKFKEKGMTGKDVHKPGAEIPEMGGVAVALGFFSGLFLILFFIKAEYPAIIAACIAILGAVIIGVIDDLINIRQRLKGALPFFFGIPLGLVLADRFIAIPFVGDLNVGVLIFVLVPLAITCASNATNMLEGFNGLSSGMVLIMGATLAFLGALQGEELSTFFLLPMLSALVVFLFFNSYPSRIFPGDTLTLFMGAVIAASAIMSNLYVFALILYSPFIAEFFLKFFGKLKRSRKNGWTRTVWAQSFGTVGIDKTLHYTGPVESLTHLLMKNFVLKEYQLVFMFWGMEFMLAIVTVLLFFLSEKFAVVMS